MQAAAGGFSWRSFPIRAKIALGWIVFAVLAALLAPWLAPYDPLEVGLTMPTPARTGRRTSWGPTRRGATSSPG